VKARHSDTTPAWIARRFAKIEKQIREQAAAKRAQAMTILRGGVTIRDGGFLLTKYASGGNAVYLGPIDPAAPTDGSNIAMLDEDGFVIFLVSRALAPTESSTIYARADTVDLMSKSATSALHIDDSQAYLISNDMVHLYATNGVTIQYQNTAAAANCFIDPSDGRIWRSTSSRRRKVDIEDAEVDPAAVLKMRPRTFRDKGQVDNDPDTTTRFIGFIAEELHDLGLTDFVDYDDEGRPDAISYDRLTAAIIPVLKDLNARVAALEAKAAES
jgi:hypothetical protein